MSETIIARRLPIKGRRPPQARDGRRCAQLGCGTLLSRYNRRDLCYVHAGTRFPRVRGTKSR